MSLPVIVGRTDTRAIEWLQGAIARAERYLEAGADVLFIEGGKTPNLSVQELEEMGYKLDRTDSKLEDH